jgi:hypothetical protein
MKKIATNPQIIYTIVRSVATLLTAFGIFQFTEADIDQIVAWAGATYLVVDLAMKSWQVK